VETLGSATTICSDKTGTLTRNEMTVRAILTASGRVDFTGIGYDPAGAALQNGAPVTDSALQSELERLLLAGFLANNATLQPREEGWRVDGDPTEGALKVAAIKAGLDPVHLEARFGRIGEIPFSSDRKMMSTAHTDAERKERVLLLSKGAPDVLLSRCAFERIGAEARPLTPERREAILAAVEQMAGEGLRTLGAAYRTLQPDTPPDALSEHLEQEFVWLGLIGMTDPPRPEARDAVQRARRAGIRVLLITGDHPRTAAAIAAELGILDKETRAVTGAQLQQMTPEQLRQVTREVSVYARVSPEHKLRIVEALQANGAIVAMTGDGVNDAPALKRADIGVAMGLTGTDVAKSAADMILTDDNFASIVAAIEEGRAIFANIQKFLRYLLSSNIGEVLTMFFGVALAGVIGLTTDAPHTLTLPLLATMILWINLLTDSGPALALGLDPVDPIVMERPPRDPHSRIITRPMWQGIFFVGAIMAAGTLFVLDLALPGGLVAGDRDLTEARSMAFTTLVLFQLFNVFNARSDTRSAFRRLFQNGWLWAALLLSLGLQFLVIYAPPLQRAFSTSGLTAQDWLICAAVASSALWLRELEKLARRHLFQRTRQERAGPSVAS
jgi:Ca2+-transporting ATPase